MRRNESSIRSRLHIKATIYIATALIVACQLFMTTSDGICFTLEQSENTPLLIRENAPDKTPQPGFAIPDNLNLCSPTNTAGKILLPISNNFVSVDIIDSNLPIFSEFRYPSTLGRDSFANFLYANLKIKKLLREYAESQQRAQELLSSSTHQTAATGMNAQNSIRKAETKHIENSDRQLNVLFLTLRQLQRNFNAGTTAEYLNEYVIQNPVINLPTNKHSIIPTNEIQANLIRKNESLADSSTATSSPARGIHPSYKSSYEVKLPWILDLPFKLFDFFLANKIACLTSALLLLGVFNIIFGSRS